MERKKRKALRPSHYLLKFASQSFWRKLLRLELDIMGILGGQIERLSERIRRIALAAALTSRPETFAQHAMNTLSKRHVKTLFLYQPDNGGIEMFEENFGAAGTELYRFQGASIQFVPTNDRKLSYDQSLRIGGSMMIEFLKKSAPTSLL